MSYKLINTALDHTKRFLHRTASKMQMEPVIGGRRLRIRSTMIISDEIFEHNKANLALWRGWGVVDWEQVGGEKSKAETPKKKSHASKSGDEPKTLDEEMNRMFKSEDTGLKIEPQNAPAEESPPAETTSSETKPQPKSPFKGKKQ